MVSNICWSVRNTDLSHLCWDLNYDDCHQRLSLITVLRFSTLLLNLIKPCLLQWVMNPNKLQEILQAMSVLCWRQCLQVVEASGLCQPSQSWWPNYSVIHALESRFAQMGFTQAGCKCKLELQHRMAGKTWAGRDWSGMLHSGPILTAHADL